MVTHSRNLGSTFNPSKVHTHTMNTHPEQWAVINAAAPWEQLVVRCLAQEHLSRGIEGGESAVHSLPPPTIPAGFAKHIIMRIDLVQVLQRQFCKGKTF